MKRLLIEEGLPFGAINEASHREKSGNAPSHPRRLHRWWARRPLAMSRALVFGSLIPDPDDEATSRSLHTLIAAASLFKDAGKDHLIAPLRDELAIRSGTTPKVLDPFAGGGAIPLEALRLNCDTTALDLNPIAYLIERAMLEFPQRYENSSGGATRLSDDFAQWAEWLRQRVHAEVGHLYQTAGDGRPLVWFWARTTRCRNPLCAVEYPLVKSWWLARGRRRVWLEPHPSEIGVRLELGSGPDHAAGTDPSVGTIRASSATCPSCGTTIPAADVRQIGLRDGFGVRLLAVLEYKEGRREYRLPTDADPVGIQAALAFAERITKEGRIPHEKLNPHQYRKFGMIPFGVGAYSDLFTPRQLVMAASLCSGVTAAFRAMCEEGYARDRAAAVGTYLAFAVSRILDYNSAFCTWHQTGEKINPTLLMPSVSMIWDFTEIDPFAPISGDFKGGVDSIVAAIVECAKTGTRPATVVRGNAQDLPFPDAYFDAVITDPPYYDSYQYSDLSDFFYVWMKLSLGEIFPELFATELTPKSQEVIENRADKKSPSYLSSDEFERRLIRAIAEMRRVVKPEGVVTIVFAHTESDAWERLLRALLQAGLIVSTSWPMKSEMASRSTAHVSAVLGSSVVLVCRPRVVDQPAFYDDVVRELDARIGERLDEFEALGLVGADYLISAIGPAFEVFGRYSAVHRLNGMEVSVADLLALARRTVAQHAMRRLLGSEALSAVDDVTLLYLTWRWAYGGAKIPVDEAQKLGKAFHVEVDELAGVDSIVVKTKDAYGLNGPDERKRIRFGSAPRLIDVLHVACQLHDGGRRSELAELLASTGFAEEPGFWATARAIAESLPDGDRERTLLVNLLGGREQTVEAARATTPTEALRLFEEAK